MLTGSTFEVVVVLALIAVVHTVVSTLIARKLTRDEQALAETSNNVLVSAPSTGCLRTTSPVKLPNFQLPFSPFLLA
jgi:hypothetical protein